MLSIIIPVYNGELYIEETIRNILNGEYQDFEILVVIDGTHDKSLDIVDSISDTDKRVKSFYKENGGIAEARNYGISKAAGKYICVCDQDDVIQPEMYSRMIRSLEENQADMAICSNAQLAGESVIPLENFDDDVLCGDRIFEEILYPTITVGYEIPVKMTSNNRYPNIWKAVIRKSFWDGCGLQFHAYVSFEDDLLAYAKLLSIANRVVTVSYVGYLWKINLGSESHTRKYIEDIGHKQQLWHDDIVESLKLSNMDSKNIDMISKIVNCQLYVFAVLNLCGAGNTVKFKDIPDYFEKNIFGRQWKECIEASNYASRKYPMQFVIARSLRHRHPYITYTKAKLLVFILDVVLNNKLLIKLDKVIKGK